MPEIAVLDLCGKRLDFAVQAVLSLWRASWAVAINRTEAIASGEVGGAILPAQLVREALLKELSHPSAASRFLAPDATARLCDGLLAPFELETPGQLYFPGSHFCAFDVACFLLSGAAPDADLHYLTARELRRRNGVSLSASAMRAFQIYTNRLRSWVSSLPASQQKRQHFGMLLLKAQLDNQQKPAVAEEIQADSYLELVQAIGWVQPSNQPGELQIEIDRFDAEVLAGRYFGFPTAIPGLDHIFAEAGPLIVDAPEAIPVSNDSPPPLPQPIGGRTILVIGPYGTGKSTLTLQMAIEVARKGGIAIVAAMEQTAEECIYAMEALGMTTRSATFDVVGEMRAAMPRLSLPYDGRGTLAFLPIQQSILKMGDSESGALEALLVEVTGRLTWMDTYPLRLLIVDPLNGILEAHPHQQLESRKKLVAFFHEAKRRGVNIWLTSERSPDQTEESPFDENIADTVLQLSVDRSAQHQRRTIEVRKSRLQRDEPGKHSLLISPRAGVEIYPSSTSIARAVYHTPTTALKPKATRFNIEGIDRILGPNALLKGDVIGLDGAPGSSRTFLGIHFLFGLDASEDGQVQPATSLLVADSSEDKLRSLLLSACGSSDPACLQKTPADVRLCPIVPGLMEPSQILQYIAEQFRLAKAERRPIDRVMISDLSRWEMSMPLLMADPAFGPALLGMLRYWKATSVLLADYVSGERSLLTDMVVNNADCVFHFERLEFRGQTRQFVRATKSHTMGHRRDSFELFIENGSVRVETYASLLRKDAAGNVKSVTIRLFLHADSPHHKEFNDQIVGSIKTSLTNAVVEEQLSHYDPGIFSLSASSAVDEVQVMQLDEFQLPNPQNPRTSRQFFPYRPDGSETTKHTPSDYIPRLAKRISADGGQTYVAMPFYENISLLALHEERMDQAARLVEVDWQAFAALEGAAPWEWVRRLAIEWEKQGDDYVFFSCPLAQLQAVETYNCLFFEMLQGYRGLLPVVDCRLSTWLSGEEVNRAAYAFRDLFHRSHVREKEFFKTAREEPDGRKLRVFGAQSDFGPKGPVMWRHWYNTLSQMLWDLPPGELAGIKVRPLFNDITTAGEWYLLVPSYSAAPELAWQIIDQITAADRELQRIYRGVGLPTRTSYYRRSNDTLPPSPISPFFHISRTKLEQLVNGAFERSQFPCYQQFSEPISAHLQRILELPPESPKVLESQIDSIMESLRDSLSYIQDTVVCHQCRKTEPRPSRENATRIFN